MRKEAGNNEIPWAGLAELERERLARKVVKLKGAYVNLREIVDIMQSAPEKSGNDLLFASELLEKVVLETDRYLADLNALLGMKGRSPRMRLSHILGGPYAGSAAKVAARFLNR